MQNDREFRLPKALLAVLAVNAGIALAAYGACDARRPAVSSHASMHASSPGSSLVVTAPVFVTPPPPALDEVEPDRDEIAAAPGPSQIGRDPFHGAPEPKDAGARDPCGKCGMG